MIVEESAPSFKPTLSLVNEFTGGTEGGLGNLCTYLKMEITSAYREFGFLRMGHTAFMAVNTAIPYGDGFDFPTCYPQK
ncbi:unnamed protein product [Allacma fusca]|uniref:Uncharacterized protein n=1 Tax=Allacma fusca TaxID=39272 RepID=A0A8J2KSP4_9HEXA|nr:unnamed protein product [Allacma fusca]